MNCSWKNKQEWVCSIFVDDIMIYDIKLSTIILRYCTCINLIYKCLLYSLYIWASFWISFFIWPNSVTKSSLFAKHPYINCINITKFVISVENHKKGRKCTPRKSNVNEYCIHSKTFLWRIATSRTLALVKSRGRGIVLWWIRLSLVGGSLHLYWCS